MDSNDIASKGTTALARLQTRRPRNSVSRLFLLRSYWELTFTVICVFTAFTEAVTVIVPALAPVV